MKRAFFNFFLHSLLFILFGSFAYCQSSVGQESTQSLTIVIDPGHGGRDPGTLGSTVKEKDIALKVSLKLGKLLKASIPNLKIIYTRLEDKFVELHRRAEIANENRADLFISIHCNSLPLRHSGRQRVQGTEVYVMGLHKNKENLAVAKRENASILKEANYQAKYDGFDPNSPQSYILLSLRQQMHLENSLSLARKVDFQLSTQVKRVSRGVKQAGFVVLAKTTMPSILIELGFLSNLSEEKYLNADASQSNLANGIYRAVKAYVEEIRN